MQRVLGQHRVRRSTCILVLAMCVLAACSSEPAVATLDPTVQATFNELIGINLDPAGSACLAEADIDPQRLEDGVELEYAALLQAAYGCVPADMAQLAALTIVLEDVDESETQCVMETTFMELANMSPETVLDTLSSDSLPPEVRDAVAPVAVERCAISIDTALRVLS